MLSLLGEETTRVLTSAREAAGDIRTKAEQGAERIIAEASSQAAQTRSGAVAEADKRLAEAKAEADQLLTAARGELERRTKEATEAAQRITAEGLSVRAVEEIVALGGDEPKPTRPPAPRAGDRNEALDDLAARLSDRFETRVKIALGKAKGRVTVEFASVQDLNRIIGAMAPGDPGVFHR